MAYLYQEIELSRGKKTLVSKKDFKKIDKYKWYCSTKGYAVRNIKTETGRGIEYMHRTILGANAGETCDHINRDKLDNRKNNLRIVSASQNIANSKLHTNNTSGYKGVAFRKDNKMFRAYVSKDGKRIHLGQFETAKEAARKYNEFAKRLHGKYANLNILK